MAMILFRKKRWKNQKLYRNENAVSILLRYAVNPEKTPSAIIGATGVSTDSVDYMINQFLTIQKIYKKRSGKRIIHFLISFSKADMEQLVLEDYRYIGYAIAEYFSDHQVVFALHENTEYYHIHFVVNPVNIKTGHKFRWLYSDTDNLKKILKRYNV